MPTIKRRHWQKCPLARPGKQSGSWLMKVWSFYRCQQLFDSAALWRYFLRSTSFLKLQIEHHPYLVQPQLIAMAQEGIVVTGYSTLGPQSFLELPPAFRKRAADVPMLFDSQVIEKIAGKHGKSPAQVLLRWATQRRDYLHMKSA